MTFYDLWKEMFILLSCDSGALAMVDGVSRRQLAAVTSGAKYESAPVRLEGFILFYFRKSSYKSCKRRWGKNLQKL